MNKIKKTTPVGTEIVSKESTASLTKEIVAQEQLVDKGITYELSLSPKTEPQENKAVKNIESWIETRKNFIKNVVSIMVEGKDFHKIKFGGKEVQVLAKGGAEKVVSALGWTAEFVKDNETYEMLGSPAGTLCYICNLKNGEFVGQGRGARNIKQDAGDVNKTIKMAQKSAYIDATLRASGLSDLFTQDLDEVQQSDQIGTSLKPTFGKPGINKLDDEEKRVTTMIKDLEACNTQEEIEQTVTHIKIAFTNGKISKANLDMVLKVGRQLYAKLKPIDADTQKIVDNLEL